MQLKRFLFATIWLVAGFFSVAAFGQQLEPLPVDPAVRMGTLPNGLTYIVRHNANPKNRANYYIAQKVGSILEEDSQRGLAHFLEHMAFNGTKNFPDKKLIGFLESIGCRFGADLNAYTAFDETVYTIMDAPTDRGKGIIDSCLLIMHDWSNSISLVDKEIDEERGVIHEEWRSRDNAGMRTFTALLPRILPNNKYAVRMPIGTMEVVDNFKYKEIHDFYHKWYRPDLQGIIVVGDIDPDYVVAKLKEIFSDIPAPKNPAERYYVQVEDNATPIVAIAKDKESTSTSLKVVYKHDVLPVEMRSTIVGMMYNFIDQVVAQVINERFEELSRKPTAPFMHAGAANADYMGITKTKKALHFIAVPKEGELTPTVNVLATEIRRLKEHGVTQSEFDRARTNILKAYETMFNERNNAKNASFCEEYKEYFLNGGYIPGIEMENEMIKALAQQMNPSVVNEFLKEVITDGKNLVITVEGPDKKDLKYPTEAELQKLYETSFAQSVEAKKEEVSDTKLIEKEIKSGKIVAEKKNQKFGSTEWTLSNGVKVYLKKTDFKDDEIRMTAATHGGTRLYKSASDIQNAKIVNSAIGLGGLGKFDAVALGRALTGRRANVSASVGAYTTGVSGSSSVEDFETMLQLVHLYFTSIRKDDEAFQTFKNNTIEQLKMKERNPLSSLGDSIMVLLYDNNPLYKNLTIEDMNKVSYDRALAMARERFASADGFQFFFVGNFDEATVRPLIEKYIGGLPKGKAVKKMDRSKEPASRNGAKTMMVKKEMETPTGVVVDFMKASAKYNLKEELTSQILNGVLEQTLVASIREREGGTYSPATGTELSEYPKPQVSTYVQFFCDPERAEQLNKIVYEELNAIVKKGVNKEYFDKTILNIQKRHGEVVRENGYWLGNMKSFFFDGENWVDGYEATLSSITTKDVQNMLSRIMGSGNRLELYFRSAETTKK
ncbi:M16 family metallopeptidase [Porphyromonas circumdentaria]|uniref:Zinc protease n=1 Tax=Porphyromonas circumdentaria TaxID=29524 RepID=A0A1T4PY98_9PORP|nr:M16 family metallopeptidase [Porphyromonas circumdentaria]MBB6276531.1 zinc protease [Porphyromonas circumdentaria]MDO4722486.1 insulinase family protein [Porphyromonas circumdentaria]SJZ96530.1 zinc protease [Porphyromonas circumdentaria]